MLYFFLICSCAALKLSDPRSLRDVNEENASLQAWCAGVGCVMPFTPASCLSWCDWNVDKQADAEARGAFGGSQWGKKQVTAKDYYINLYLLKAVQGEPAICDDAPVKDTNWAQYYFQGSGTNDKADFAAIFPGGDSENKFAQTELKCAGKAIEVDGVKDVPTNCYKIRKEKIAAIAGVSKVSLGLQNIYYMSYTKAAAGKSSTMQLFKGVSKDKAILKRLKLCDSTLSVAEGFVLSKNMDPVHTLARPGTTSTWNKEKNERRVFAPASVCSPLIDDRADAHGNDVEIGLGILFSGRVDDNPKHWWATGIIPPAGPC